MRETFDRMHGRQKAVLSKLQPQTLINALAAQVSKAEADADALQVCGRVWCNSSMQIGLMCTPGRCLGALSAWVEIIEFYQTCAYLQRAWFTQ